MSSRDGLAPKHFLANIFVLLITGAVLICAAAILFPIWDMVRHSSDMNISRDPHQCFNIPHGPERLACFEKLLQQPPPQPARGANAPEKLWR
jgi:hypothetical protein